MLGYEHVRFAVWSLRIHLDILGDLLAPIGGLVEPTLCGWPQAKIALQKRAKLACLRVENRPVVALRNGENGRSILASTFSVFTCSILASYTVHIHRFSWRNLECFFRLLGW